MKNSRIRRNAQSVAKDINFYKVLVGIIIIVSGSYFGFFQRLLGVIGAVGTWLLSLLWLVATAALGLLIYAFVSSEKKADFTSVTGIITAFVIGTFFAVVLFYYAALTALTVFMEVLAALLPSSLVALIFFVAFMLAAKYIKW